VPFPAAVDAACLINATVPPKVADGRSLFAGHRHAAPALVGIPTGRHGGPPLFGLAAAAKSPSSK
jgi:hypothetical protein